MVHNFAQMKTYWKQLVISQALRGKSADPWEKICQWGDNQLVFQCDMHTLTSGSHGYVIIANLMHNGPLTPVNHCTHEHCEEYLQDHILVKVPKTSQLDHLLEKEMQNTLFMEKLKFPATGRLWSNRLTPSVINFMSKDNRMYFPPGNSLILQYFENSKTISNLLSSIKNQMVERYVQATNTNSEEFLWLPIQQITRVLELVVSSSAKKLWKNHLAHCDLHFSNILILSRSLESHQIQILRSHGLLIDHPERKNLYFVLESSNIRYIDLSFMISINAEKSVKNGLPCARYELMRREDLFEIYFAAMRWLSRISQDPPFTPPAKANLENQKKYIFQLQEIFSNGQSGECYKILRDINNLKLMEAFQKANDLGYNCTLDHQIQEAERILTDIRKLVHHAIPCARRHFVVP